MAKETDGTLTVGSSGLATLRFARELPYPASRVWQALTDPAEMENWFMTAVLEPRRGGRLHLESGEPGGTVGQVLEWDPPRRLAYSWRRGGGSGATSIVRWSLQPSGTGTHLELVHSDLDPTSATDYEGGWYNLLAGWHDLLARLPHVLEGAEPAAFNSEHSLLLTHYRNQSA